MKNKLLFLSALSFVLISTSVIAMNSPEKLVYVFSKTYPNKKYTDIPILINNNSYPVLSAQSALVVDIDSGVKLYEKDPEKILLPASTTKIVTALVALDVYELDHILRVPSINVEGQKMGLVWGEEMKVIDLLKGLLIFSANDAAEVLATNHPAGREMFIALMNKKAKDLGMNNTHFSNPTGLDNGNQYVTARDLAIVAKYAMRNSIFSEIVGTKQATVTSMSGKNIHKLTNINKLLGSVDGVLGVKTGWTESARENLVTEVERNGRRLMIVVLGSSDRFGETTELINWSYSSYEWQEVKPYSE